jgi:hypothetical protein
VGFRDRALYITAAILARLTGLDELLEAVALPLLFLEYCRERGKRSLPRSCAPRQPHP